MTYLIDNKFFCVNITKFACKQVEEENGYQKKCIEILKKSFITIHRNISLQRVEMIYKIRNGLIVILLIIIFVAQIVLNNCV